jgi:hypothetical protein
MLYIRHGQLIVWKGQCVPLVQVCQLYFPASQFKYVRAKKWCLSFIILHFNALKINLCPDSYYYIEVDKLSINPEYCRHIKIKLKEIYWFVILPEIFYHSLSESSAAMKERKVIKSSLHHKFNFLLSWFVNVLAFGEIYVISLNWVCVYYNSNVNISLDNIKLCITSHKTNLTFYNVMAVPTLL